jgi:hypothetical protein
MIDVGRLIEEEGRAWEALRLLFERVPADRFELATLTPEGWSPKDAMFHIAGWMDDCATQLDRMCAGSFDPGEETRESIERQNQAWFEVSSTMSPGEVRERFPAARKRMLDAFGALEEVTSDAVEWFEESGALHYAKHVEDLRSFVEEPER